MFHRSCQAAQKQLTIFIPPCCQGQISRIKVPVHLRDKFLDTQDVACEVILPLHLPYLRAGMSGKFDYLMIRFLRCCIRRGNRFTLNLFINLREIDTHMKFPSTTQSHMMKLNPKGGNNIITS